MNDKKEDKKTKAKNEETKEENQSENGETKTNEVHAHINIGSSLKKKKSFVELCECKIGKSIQYILIDFKSHFDVHTCTHSAPRFIMSITALVIK